MQSIKLILTVLAPHSDNQFLLNKAIYLAKQYDAKIELVLVVYNSGLVTSLFFSPTELDAAKEGYLNSLKKKLSRYSQSIDKENIPVASDAIWHKPHYEGIIEYAKKVGADLILKGTHKHKVLDKVFFTPNDWQLLKSSSIPLILAKETTAAQYQTVLAGIDPTHAHSKPESLDNLVIDSAMRFAGKMNATCHVTHCYSPIEYQVWNDIGLGMGIGIGPADFTMGEENYSEYINQLKENQESQFNEVVGPFKLPQENLHLVEGYPEQKLPEMVEEMKVDLLVLGTAYHSGLVGSTAEKILDEVNCDVLSVQIQRD
ncbi:universal stress protein [Aliikangiella maris]|uniref:Universal stress protein n=2 Tax=Aliikangiella maris TaxID=3162458 RepID=A0ABV3ML71_9GAMM